MAPRVINGKVQIEQGKWVEVIEPKQRDLIFKELKGVRVRVTTAHITHIHLDGGMVVDVPYSVRRIGAIKLDKRLKKFTFFEYGKRSSFDFFDRPVIGIEIIKDKNQNTLR